MARRTAKQKNKEKKLAMGLVGLLLVVALTALLVAVPQVKDWLWQISGIGPAEMPPPTGSASTVAVHIIDVGQGDAALLSADGEFALLDAGPPEGTDVLLSYLQNAGVQRLRYVVMTHPHADHIGGMQAVIERFDVGLVVLPDFSLAPYPTTKTFESLLETMLNKNIAAETATVGAVYPLGGGKMTIVHAGLPTEDNYNLLSVAVLFEAEGLRFLNTGDGEKPNERAMLESGLDLSASVFMAAHHGSSTSNSEEFIAAVAPQMVVISCAAGNPYGHPHRPALRAFEQCGAMVLRTDKQGHVVIQPDGNGGLVYGVSREQG